MFCSYCFAKIGSVAQGSSSGASQTKLLKRTRGQAVITFWAAVSMNTVPLDFVLTDTREYVLYWLRGNQLLVYDGLTAVQVAISLACIAQHECPLVAQYS